MDRRTTLYNHAVTHYHKAKLDRADLARELEAVKVEAAKVPQLESDLRAARAQCAESEEAGRSAAGKLKLAEQELTRLRLLEQNHLTELNSLRTLARFGWDSEGDSPKRFLALRADFVGISWFYVAAVLENDAWLQSHQFQHPS
nr:uncharacterized protein LOC127346648 [Lolium perenne]